MRSVALLLGCVLLVLCLFKDAEAVACTAVGVPADCTDCSDPLNEDDDDCTTTTTSTTAATTTTTATSVTTVRRRRRPKRKVVRLTNVRYTNVHRVRVNGNRVPATTTNRRRNSNARVVRVNVG